MRARQKGFIKAFSDSPVFFTKSFCKVNRIMKNLFVGKLFIYPRFHVDIEAELSKHKVIFLILRLEKIQTVKFIISKALSDTTRLWKL